MFLPRHLATALAGLQSRVDAVIKALRTGEQFWRTKFDHKIRLYEVFTENPPLVRLPELVHTDGHRVRVIEHIPGHPVDTERYPTQPLPATALVTVLGTIAGFNAWILPGGVLALVFGYPTASRATTARDSSTRTTAPRWALCCRPPSRCRRPITVIHYPPTCC